MHRGVSVPTIPWDIFVQSATKNAPSTGAVPGSLSDDMDSADTAALSEIQQLLPPALLELDPDILQELISNEAVLLSLITADGTVDEGRLRQLKMEHAARTSHDNSAYANFDSRSYADMSSTVHSRPEDSFYGGLSLSSSDRLGDSAKRSRPLFDSSLEFPSANRVRTQDYPRSSGVPSTEQWAPAPSADWFGGGQDRFVEANSAAIAAAAAARTQFPTTKSNTPCRYFNTPGGCQRGDACTFGHFPADIAARKNMSIHAMRK